MLGTHVDGGSKCGTGQFSGPIGSHCPPFRPQKHPKLLMSFLEETSRKGFSCTLALNLSLATWVLGECGGREKKVD